MPSHSQHRLALPAGTSVGSYRITGLLGQGGFGITYLAEHATLGRKVALKELLPVDFATRDEHQHVVPISPENAENLAWALQRFIEEARNIERCKHPNVLHVHDVFEANGTAYMPTSYEPGCTLTAWLSGLGRPPTEPEALSLLLPLLDGLEHVHAMGLLHRDIKPDNIWIRQNGPPMLLDFGAAREVIGSRSRSMTALVSSGYTPLEQYSAEDASHIGPASDLYAFAATAYRMLTGEKPPEATRRLSRAGRDPLQPLATRLHGLYAPSLLAALDGCLAVLDQDRIQSVAHLRALIFTPPAITPAAQPVPQAPPASPPVVAAEPAEADGTRLAPAQPRVPVAPGPRPPSGARAPVKAKSSKFTLMLVLAAILAVTGIVLLTRSGNKATPTSPTPPSIVTTPSPTPAPPVTPVPAPVQAPAPMPVPAPMAPPPKPKLALQSGSVGSTVTLELPGNGSVTFCYCPEGSFEMGSPSSEPERDEDETPVTARISNAFWMAATEITQAQWQAIMSSNPSVHKGPDLPVENISWEEAREFASKLSQNSSLPPGWKAVLPTEAVWEYACRAGGKTPFSAGSRLPGKEANYDGTLTSALADSSLGDSIGKTRAVKYYKPNAWGLYDMHGNVWEWCSDWYGTSRLGGSNPRGPASGLKRLTKGGAWFTSATACRAAFRGASSPSQRNEGIGFRIALVQE